MDPIKEALTFDDVTLAPQYSKVLPSDVSTKTYLSNQLKLDIPILSSAMDTVTESKMAIALAKQGGIGVIHRNLTISQQINEIKKVKSKRLKVGAAVGTNESELNRIKNILKLNIDLIVVDTAHGHSQKVADTILKIKKIKPKKTTLCAGNIATAEAARYLCKLGVDVIKVGIGPGSICTTRLVAGIGVPQLSALLDVKKGLNKKVKIISDGGIKFSGDLAKAITAGADAIMIGSLFSGTSESPGKILKRKGKLFKTINIDRMLANISLYWFTGCIGGSFWPYYIRHRSDWPIDKNKPIEVPTGYSEFPKELFLPPKTLADQFYKQINFWKKHKTGGHFAALEQPDELVLDINDFVKKNI